MSNITNRSAFAPATTSLASARANLDAPRSAHADEARSELETSQIHALYGGSYYTNAGRTALYGVREGAHSAFSGAAAAAHAGAAAGFAAAGVVAQGASVVSRGILSGFARGFLALSNVLAAALGEKPATREAAEAPRKTSFAERMFARARASLAQSKAIFGAAGRGAVDAAKVGVAGTAANFALGGAATVRAAGRLASAGWHGAAAASYWGAQATLSATRTLVTAAEASVQRARAATLRIAEQSANAAGDKIVVA